MVRGVLDELQAPGQVLERAIEVARDLASMPSDGYRRIKRQVRADAIQKLDDLVRDGSDPMMQQWVSPATAEASAAVLGGAERG